VCGSANGYVESLDPLLGKEEAERDEVQRGRKGGMRAHAHRATLALSLSWSKASRSETIAELLLTPNIALLLDQPGVVEAEERDPDKVLFAAVPELDS
jgi:hypothetical protein